MGTSHDGLGLRRIGHARRVAGKDNDSVEIRRAVEKARPAGRIGKIGLHEYRGTLPPGRALAVGAEPQDYARAFVNEQRGQRRSQAAGPARQHHFPAPQRVNQRRRLLWQLPADGPPPDRAQDTRTLPPPGTWSTLRCPPDYVRRIQPPKLRGAPPCRRAGESAGCCGRAATLGRRVRNPSRLSRAATSIRAWWECRAP